MIAGLSLGVLVIEAARRSGSLTTARLAGEYNREVFALPGRVDSDYSTGTNSLIRDQHAKLTTCTEDIINELGDVGEVLAAPKDCADTAELPVSKAVVNVHEKAVLDLLGVEGLSVENMAETGGQPARHVASTLISLQLRGLVRQLPGNVFVRVARSGKK